MLWVSGRGRVIARDADGRAERVANIVVDVTERKNAEEHVQLLMREMTHRSKNLLAVVQALAARTARTAGTLEEFERRYTQRLKGLAASNDLLLQRSWRGAPLTDLARKQLAPFAEAGGARLSLQWTGGYPDRGGDAGGRARVARARDQCDEVRRLVGANRLGRARVGFQ